MAASGTTALGSYSVDADGHWSYAVNNALVQHLAAGASTTDSFTVKSLDDTAGQTVTITINGANDAASISGDTSGSVKEATAANAGIPSVSSVLQITDPDDNQAVFQAVTAGKASYGSYAVTTDGHWTYTLDNTNAKVDALNNGQTLTDQFVVYSADNTPRTINVTINGTTDDLGGPTGIQLNLNANAGNQLNNLGTFVALGDLDVGDTFTWSVGAGSTSGFDVTNGVLNASAVDPSSPATLVVVATDQANNAFSETFHVLIGGSGADTMTFVSGTTNNIASGGSGNDVITGSAGTDYILGGSNNDTIQANGGADFLVGGNGNDHFVYAAKSDSTVSASDTILDFKSGADTIDFKSVLGLTTVMASDFGSATTLGAHTIGWHSDGTNTSVYANLGSASESMSGGADIMKILVLGTDFHGSDINKSV